MKRRTAAPRLLALSFLFLVMAGCRDGARPENGARNPERGALTPAEREAALAAARVWLPPRVPARAVDFSRNPEGPGAFDEAQDVECTFKKKKAGGTTPKFYCTLPDGDTVKVKYGEPNGEIPSEIVATRLLAALGFPTDRMYRVHSVRCKGCPPMPQQALQCLAEGGPEVVCLQGAADSRVVTFEHAAVERPFPGRKMEAAEDQGWSWYELDKIDPARGGSSRAEVDALRLIAIVIAHWDNKGENQRLVCPHGKDRPDGSCTQPLAMVQDLGAALGPKRMDLLNWRRVPVWTDTGACQVSMTSLPFRGATFTDRQISEEGRQFALKLLRALSAAQLNTLFEAAGVTTFSHVLTEAHQPQAWTDAFLAKVDAIASAGPCPKS
ncbi:MAG TPA: hypothetical protein VFK57_09435 [Vicinamibacterales bacterium]|nr:hypothetical protein [Vicinamibacterales bacterium]